MLDALCNHRTLLRIISGMNDMGGVTASGVIAGAIMVLAVMHPLRFAAALPVVLLPSAWILSKIDQNNAADQEENRACGRGVRRIKRWIWEEESFVGGEGGDMHKDPKDARLRRGKDATLEGAHEGGEAIAAELRGLMDLVMRDIIHQWYCTAIAENDMEFLDNLDDVLNVLIASLSRRLTDIPMSRLACSVEEVLTLLKEHSRCHNAGLAQHALPDAPSNSEEYTEFDAFIVREYEAMVRFPAEGCLHPGSKDASQETRFWRGVFGRIVPLLLGRSKGITVESELEFKHSRHIESGAVAIGSDLLASRCLVPLTDLLSDPDFINGMFIGMAASSAAAQPNVTESEAGKHDGAQPHRRAKSESWLSFGKRPKASKQAVHDANHEQRDDSKRMCDDRREADAQGGHCGLDEGNGECDDQIAGWDVREVDAMPPAKQGRNGSIESSGDELIESSGEAGGGEAGVGHRGLDCDLSPGSEKVGSDAGLRSPDTASHDALRQRRSVSHSPECGERRGSSRGSAAEEWLLKNDSAVGAKQRIIRSEEGNDSLLGAEEGTRATGSTQRQEEDVELEGVQKDMLNGEAPFVMSCPVPTKAVIVSANVVASGDGGLSVPPQPLPNAGVSSWVKSEKYAVYVVEVMRSDRKGNIVARRYMDFFRLHTILSNGASRENVQQLKLPSKKVFTLGNLSEAFLQERKELLQQYLDNLLECPALAQSIPVKFFLMPHAAGPIGDAFYASQTMLELAGEGKSWGKKKGGFMSLSISRGATMSPSASPIMAVALLPPEAKSAETEIVVLGDASVCTTKACDPRFSSPGVVSSCGMVMRGDDSGEEPGREREGSEEAAEEAGQERLEAGQERLEAGQERLEAGQERLEAGQERLEENGDKSVHAVASQPNHDVTPASNKSMPRTISPKNNGVQISAGEVSDALLALVDEVLELGGRGWLRRRTHSLMLLLLNATSYDLSIEARLLCIVEGACAEPSITRLLGALKEICWPGGGPLAVGKASKPDEQEKARRAAECSKGVKALLRRSPIAIMLSRGSVDRAGLRLFSIAQSRRLNKHLTLCALEILLRLIFPELEDASPVAVSRLDHGSVVKVYTAYGPPLDLENATDTTMATYAA